MWQKPNNNKFDIPHEIDVAWCPGCGNFPILLTFKKALEELGVEQQKVVLVSGIGQAAKLPQYMNAHYFNGLHGRALPAATGIKAANPELTVVVTSGDGDVYGEGGNHFLHTIRRNPNITVIVHDNMIYGLTKGQASPTSETGLVTPTQPQGVYVSQMNPLAVAISLDASFVARTSAGEVAHMKEMMKAAIQHKGFSLLDIFQPCTVFNKVNTYQWFKEKTYFLEEAHNPADRVKAFKRATEEDKLGLGIFSQHDRHNTFEERVPTYTEDKRPLFERERDWKDVHKLLSSRR